VCLLLVVMWVRSYWRLEWVITTFADQMIEFTAGQGAARLDANHRPSNGKHAWRSETIDSGEHVHLNPLGVDGGWFYANRFITISSSTSRDFIWVRYWFPVLIAAMLTPLPLLSWSFSLRTLLIAATLTAAVLGLVVWSST
jgi:hypothetical protein